MTPLHRQYVELPKCDRAFCERIAYVELFETLPSGTKWFVGRYCASCEQEARDMWDADESAFTKSLDPR